MCVKEPQRKEHRFQIFAYLIGCNIKLYVFIKKIQILVTKKDARIASAAGAVLQLHPAQASHVTRREPISAQPAV